MFNNISEYAMTVCSLPGVGGLTNVGFSHPSTLRMRPGLCLGIPTCGVIPTCGGIPTFGVIPTCGGIPTCGVIPIRNCKGTEDSLSDDVGRVPTETESGRWSSICEVMRKTFI